MNQQPAIPLRIAAISLAGLFSLGCAAERRAALPSASPTARSFPPEALVVQRGVLTVHGRQVSLNGYVSKSEARGLRLVLTENFGGVLADVLVTCDGKARVIKAKPPFRPSWVERYVAADLKCVFWDATAGDYRVQVLSPTHFLVQRRRYKIELWTVETKPGPQPAETFAPHEGTAR